MAAKQVWVELNGDLVPVRIFRTQKAAVQAALAGRDVDEWPRAWAVEIIRKQVIARANSACDRCGTIVSDDSGEMHETLPRGKGGEVSLENCEWLCHDCHQGREDSAHGNRRTRFGESAQGDAATV